MNPGFSNGFRPQAFPQGHPNAGYGFDYSKVGFSQANHQMNPYYQPQPYGAPPGYYPQQPNLSGTGPYQGIPPYFQGHPYPSAPVDPFGYPVHAPPFQP